jgi:hypothetical protein
MVKNDYRSIKLFLLKMFQLIDAVDMKVGEMYFIKNREYIIGEVLFSAYHKSSQPFIVFGYPYRTGYSYLKVKDISIYRYVTPKEYWEKVKEKYDSKCLNIVLKRLVDESFQW